MAHVPVPDTRVTRGRIQSLAGHSGLYGPNKGTWALTETFLMQTLTDRQTLSLRLLSWVVPEQNTLSLDLEVVGAHRTLNSPNWENYNNIKQLFIISVLLEADTYFNLFQGSIAKLQYCIIKVLQISSNLDP